MNAVDEMSYNFRDVGVEMSYHATGILSGIKFKALFASVPAAFASYFGGNWGFLEMWFVLSVIDLVFGVAFAFKAGVFSRLKLYGWAVKALTHMITILICGVITVMLTRLTGYAAPLIDWFIFILVLTEAESILKTADKLGLPVHPLAKALVAKCKRRAESKLDELVGGKGNEND
jgi:phage-related holin